jgi:hypothetical protein
LLGALSRGSKETDCENPESINAYRREDGAEESFGYYVIYQLRVGM